MRLVVGLECTKEYTGGNSHLSKFSRIYFILNPNLVSFHFLSNTRGKNHPPVQPGQHATEETEYANEYTRHEYRNAYAIA